MAETCSFRPASGWSTNPHRSERFRTKGVKTSESRNETKASSVSEYMFFSAP
jgi:hypothetical protein